MLALEASAHGVFDIHKVGRRKEGRYLDRSHGQAVKPLRAYHHIDGQSRDVLRLNGHIELMDGCRFGVAVEDVLGDAFRDALVILAGKANPYALLIHGAPKDHAHVDADEADLTVGDLDIEMLFDTIGDK